MNTNPNIKIMIVALVVLSSMTLAKTRPYVSPVWVSDQGDGTYRNPVLYSDYSDPDVCRVENDYYMTASSFSYMPGLPILHSRDLVNWTIIGHALPRMIPADIYDHPHHGNSVWAPSIRYHKGFFYIYWGDPDRGILMVKAKNPAGPWSEPVRVLAGRGLIDPCPLWDHDGQVYLVHAWAGSRAQINSILTVNKLNAAGTKALDAGKHVFDGHDKHPTMEGPKFYRRNGFYYIFTPAGGVSEGWQVVLRSRHVYGPYEDRIVLAQGTTPINGPHQGAWVQTPRGQSWFLHFQEKEPYGRIVHLEPMQWIKDWPVIGRDPAGDGCGEPVLSHAKPAGPAQPMATPAESDEFNGDTLGLQWQWCANPDIRWSIMLRDTDYLRFFGIHEPSDARSLWDVPNLLMQKFPAPAFTATTVVTLTAADDRVRTGLLVFGRDYDVLALSHAEDHYQLAYSQCHNADRGGSEQVQAKVSIPANKVYLRVRVAAPNGTCQFAYSLNGKTYQSIGKSFLAREGAWTGAKVGIFCLSGPDAKRGSYADFDWFRVGPNATKDGGQKTEN